MNSSDPLAQLRDIHTPDPVGLWPLAWGWWLLLALVLSALGAGVYLWLRRRQRDRYRHQALEELDDALATFHAAGDTAEYLQTLSVILRRAALTAYPPKEVAGLHGAQWLTFLDETLPQSDDEPFCRGPGRALLSGPYEPNPEADVDALHQLASNWLAHHRRPPRAGRAKSSSGGANA